MPQSRITAIEPQQKHSERRSIFVDGKFALGVDQEIVLRLNLSVGQAITERELGELTRAEVVRQAKESAFTLLSYRSRSEQELRRRLRQKDYPDDVVDQVMAELIQLDLVNDARFSQDWVQNRIQTRPMGRTRLAWELRQKGVELPTVAEVTEPVDPEMEEALALDLGRARLERMREPDVFAKRRRLASLLRRRGFSWEIVNRVLDSLIPQDEPIE